MFFWDFVYILFGLLIVGLIIHNLRKPLKPLESVDVPVISAVDADFWVCAYCKTKNTTDKDKCFNCGAPRT